MRSPSTSSEPSPLPSVVSPRRSFAWFRKFILLGLSALVMAALPAGLYCSGTAPIIATAELENSGIAPLLALQDVARLTQHRGLSLDPTADSCALIMAGVCQSTGPC